jgi:chromosome segregation ATPase
VDPAESHVGPDYPEPHFLDDDGRRRIGEIFVELGFISGTQLEAALEVQRAKGGRIGEILVAQGSLSRLDLASALAEHWEPQRFPLTETRLRRSRVTSLVGSSQDGGAALEPRTGSLEALHEKLAGLDELGVDLAALNRRVASLEQGLDRLDAAAPTDAIAAGGHITAVDEAFEKRLEQVEGRQDGLAALEEGMEGLALRLEALETGVLAKATDFAERLRAHEEESAALREEVASLRRAVEEGKAGAEESTSSLKLEAGSLAARIDELRDLRAGSSQELQSANEQLSARIEELTRRVDAQQARQVEHVAATEQARLDGLAAVRATVEALARERLEKKDKKKKRKGENGAAPPESE